MRGTRPKQLARMGEFYLEEAILDVLLEAKHKGRPCLGPSEISRHAGVYAGDKTMHDVIVAGMLFKLKGEGKVQHCTQENNRNGWQLTDAQYESRRDDISS